MVEVGLLRAAEEPSGEPGQAGGVAGQAQRAGAGARCPGRCRRTRPTRRAAASMRWARTAATSLKVRQASRRLSSRSRSSARASSSSGSTGAASGSRRRAFSWISVAAMSRNSEVTSRSRVSHAGEVRQVLVHQAHQAHLGDLHLPLGDEAQQQVERALEDRGGDLVAHGAAAMVLPPAPRRTAFQAWSARHSSSQSAGGTRRRRAPVVVPGEGHHHAARPRPPPGRRPRPAPWSQVGGEAPPARAGAGAARVVASDRPTAPRPGVALADVVEQGGAGQIGALRAAARHRPGALQAVALVGGAPAPRTGRAPPGAAGAPPPPAPPGRSGAAPSTPKKRRTRWGRVRRSHHHPQHPAHRGAHERRGRRGVTTISRKSTRKP